MVDKRLMRFTLQVRVAVYEDFPLPNLVIRHSTTAFATKQ